MKKWLTYILFVLQLTYYLVGGQVKPVHEFFEINLDEDLEVENFGDFLSNRFELGMSIGDVFAELTEIADLKKRVIRIEYAEGSVVLQINQECERTLFIHEVGFYFDQNKLVDISYGKSFTLTPGV
ncbi:hypothetical protein MLD52_22510 [Puniceicoccaceae bacterium K14]|nr:hypothetical protein [Puniceicoccaceae bacterium K14]